MGKLNRRTFLRGLAGAGIGASGMGAYARWAEPHWIEIDHQTIPRPQGTTGTRGVRLLHLSDLHDSPVVSLDYIERALAIGLAQRPDLILFTGDFFTTRISDPVRYATILKRISAAAPTFACLGNHDGGYWARSYGGYSSTAEACELLARAEIVCLQNESSEVFANGRKLQVIGVGDWWSRSCLPGPAFTATTPRDGAIRILLNHNPDAKDALRAFDWDLMLCGHTHGGQLRLPLLGTPFAPVSDKRYVAGLHAWEGRWIYITHGVGNLHGLRFNCRPQVSVLNLE